MVLRRLVLKKALRDVEMWNKYERVLKRIKVEVIRLSTYDRSNHTGKHLIRK